MAGTGAAGTTHRSLSGRCLVSVTTALGQLRGSLPGSVVASRATCTRPSSQVGVLPAMLRGPAITGPGCNAQGALGQRVQPLSQHVWGLPGTGE